MKRELVSDIDRLRLAIDNWGLALVNEMQLLREAIVAINIDRKTEPNSSEKPNNCEECEHWNDTEDGCADRHGCKTEPQTPNYCGTCKHRDVPCGDLPCDVCHGYSNYAPMDEPKTDCGDFADRLAYERGVKHAWEVAQKVFDSTVTFYEAEDVARQVADTPQTEQTDCAWK